jgi:hypothetical protein
MKKITLVFTSLILVSSLGSIRAQSVIAQSSQPAIGTFDQYQLSSDDPSVSPGFGNDDYKLEPTRDPEGQEFTVPAAAVLGASTVDLNSFSYYLTSYNFVGQSYQGVLRTSATGAPIIEQTASIGSLGSGSGVWLTFSFSSAPVLTAGDTYYFDLQNTGSGGWGDIGWSVNAATGQTSGAYSANGTWFPAAARTFDASLGVAAVPEPSMFSILGLSASALLFLRRRKA